MSYKSFKASSKLNQETNSDLCPLWQKMLNEPWEYLLTGLLNVKQVMTWLSYWTLFYAFTCSNLKALYDPPVRRYFHDPFNVFYQNVQSSTPLGFPNIYMLFQILKQNTKSEKLFSCNLCQLQLCADWNASSTSPYIQSRLSTCICPYSCNDNFPTNLGLSKGGATSWFLKSTSATTLTMWNNRERSPGDAPLPPDLMNIYSEKMAGRKSGKNWLGYSCPGLILVSYLVFVGALVFEFLAPHLPRSNFNHPRIPF